MTDKLVLHTFNSLQQDTSATVDLNANSAETIAAVNNTLSRDGTSPNQMGATLDMNGNQIINLPEPSSQNSPARLIDVGTVSNNIFKDNGNVATVLGSLGPVGSRTAVQIWLEVTDSRGNNYYAPCF